MSLWAAWLQGKVAIDLSWPPTGRMTAGYSQSAKAINFIPQSSIAGKVGYAVVPGNPEHATGYNKALAADSANSMPPICSCSGRVRRRCRLRAACCPTRCAIPIGCRTSSRTSMRRCGPMRRLICATSTTPPMSASRHDHAGWQDYALSIDRMCTAVWAGTDPKQALDTAAAEWDATTERLGVDSQKAFFADTRSSRSSADHTVEKMGMACEARLTGCVAGAACSRRDFPMPTNVRHPGVSGTHGSARHDVRIHHAERWGPGFSRDDDAGQNERSSTRQSRGASSAFAARAGVGMERRHFKWLLVAPSVLLILALSVYPLLFSLWCALRQL